MDKNLAAPEITGRRRGFPGQRKDRRDLLLVAGLAALLFGCAGYRVPPAGQADWSPQAALRSVTEGAVQVPITLTARLEVRRFDKRYPAKAALMLQLPARLRFESLPPIGPPDFFLSVDQGRLAAFVPAKNAFYQGRATLANLSRFLPLALPPGELVSLLLGQPPAGTGTLKGEWEEGLYRVDRDAGGPGTDVFWIDPQARRLVRWKRFTDGDRLAMSAEFTEPTPVGQGTVPQQLVLDVSGVVLSVRYTEVLPLEAEAVFALPLPEGSLPQALD